MREFEFFHELATLSGGDDIDGVIEAGRTIRSPFEEVLTTMPGKVRKTLRVLDGIFDLLNKAALSPASR
jgi:hypothetical protein